jgi:hypothetical protein
MATDAQINANKLNAQHSTGPRTDVGKAASACNSTTRGGVSGTGKTLSPAQSDRVQAFKAALLPGNRPHDEYDMLLIEDAALARTLMWECDDRLAGLSERQADVARFGWQDQKEIEACDLAAQVRRHPYRTVRQLRQTPQGCQYLLDLWLAVQALLLKAGDLTPELAQRILDLLGTTADSRAASLSELDGRPDDTTSPLGRALAVVEREVARLRTLLADPALKDACEHARQRTIEGTEPWACKEARLLIRYRTQHARRYQWCLNELKRRRNERERRARQIAKLQEQENAYLRRAHKDPTMPAELKAMLPDPPPPPARPEKKPAPPVSGAFRTGWDRETLEAKLKQPLSKSKREHYEGMLRDLEQREAMASTPGPR